MMKQYVKQKIKHKVKLFLTRVSVRQMKKQHSETKRSVKRRKKEIVTITTNWSELKKMTAHDYEDMLQVCNVDG